MKYKSRQLREAATTKARCQRMVRDMDEMLKDKSLPSEMRREMESLRGALRKTWKELATGAQLANGRKGLSAKEADEVKPTEPTAPEADLTEGRMSDTVIESMDYVPWGVVSFAQLEAADAAQEMAHELQERAAQFSAMVNNILIADADTVADKPGAMRLLFEEFMLIVSDAFVTAADDAAMMDAEPEEAEPEPTETGEGVIQETDDQPEPLAESYAAEAVLLEEAAPESLAMLDVQIIRPGWGNARDNHFYPREMLARDAGRFVGAKMFETDHRPEEKSTRTWVSTVKEIAGFTSDGAPIARVAIHDPDFAERVRNLSAANLLEKMECSILASGRAKPFEEAGRKGKAVEAITEVSAVDWVTKAGAGGHALNLAESAAGGLVEPGAKFLISLDEGGEQFIPAQPEPVSTETAEAEPEPVAIHEQEPEPITEAAPDPVRLAETEVDAALAKTNLPPASVLALARESYTDAAALAEAIKAEIRRVKEISGSGRPFALGEAAAVSSVTPTRASIDAALDKINSKYFGR